jgi:hypothetical protein
MYGSRSTVMGGGRSKAGFGPKPNRPPPIAVGRFVFLTFCILTFCKIRRFVFGRSVRFDNL